jgi:hypothetical protein
LRTGEDCRLESRPTETPASPAASQPTHWAKLAGKKLKRTVRSRLAERVSEGLSLCRNRVLVVSTGVVVAALRRPPPGKGFDEGSEVETSAKSRMTASTGPRTQL